MSIRSLLQGLLNILTVQVGAVAGFQATLRVAMHRRPMPMPALMARFLDHPLRLAYRNPTELMGVCGIAPNEHVLDVGCGTGLYTEEAARLVGANGQVHAVDIQESLLAQAQTRLKDAGWADRVRFHLCQADTLPLADDSIDMALVIATLGEVSDPTALIDELHRILKPDGRLVVSEELLDPGYVSSPTIRRWVTDCGFRFAGRQGNVFCFYELYFK
ncbi:MAG: methyltransferase domain-containing protein [Chloroflexota bacterium]